MAWQIERKQKLLNSNLKKVFLVKDHDNTWWVVTTKNTINMEIKHKLSQKILNKIYENKNIFKDSNNSNKQLRVTELLSILKTFKKTLMIVWLKTTEWSNKTSIKFILIMQSLGGLNNYEIIDFLSTKYKIKHSSVKTVYKRKALCQIKFDFNIIFTLLLLWQNLVLCLNVENQTMILLHIFFEFLLTWPLQILWALSIKTSRMSHSGSYIEDITLLRTSSDVSFSTERNTINSNTTPSVVLFKFFVFML